MLFLSPNPEDSAWLDHALCGIEDRDIEEFFVEAGHVIAEDTLELCRRCPVRKQCATWAYDEKVTAGYFAGLSPGQRREMSLEEALAYIDRDPPTVRRKRRDRS